MAFIFLTDPPIGALQSVDYQYNIRGFLRGINLDLNNNISVGSGDVFSMKLGYETDGYFDGNIGKQEFMNTVDNVKRSFTYSYDGASRIISGTYTGTGSENYSLNSVTYDANGNIKTLSRNGYKSNSTFGVVDNLNYTYNANSNKILKVDDIGNETASFRDVTGNDYAYSLDGSLTSDANKGITSIEYNYLKLPKRVVQNGVMTLYQYDASGKKLKETIGSQVTDYVGNKIYKNNILYQISHDEGRIVDNQYEYNIKDHLGNLRVAFRDNGGIAEVVQANSYGIWGEDLPTLSYSKPLWKVDNFKFTGKESLQGTGFIDFGARWLDNIVPRFTTIDPLAEKYYGMNAYGYVLNNPVALTDPDGRYVDVSAIYTKNKNGEYENPELVTAFNNFASSKQGIALLSQFAQKGQVIAGHKYTQSGKYHTGVNINGQNVQIDLAYRATDIKDSYGRNDNTNGRTDVSINNGKGQIDILLNKNNASEKQDYINNSNPQNRNNYIWDATETILHESYIHGIYDAGDIADNGKVDRSNMPMINSYGIQKRQGQHEYYRANYTTHPYTTQGMELLQRLNNQYGIYPSNSNKKIFQHMWNFSD